MFDLSPEYAELQATVRKLAQDKIAPRARAIDTEAAYPQDVFEAFRDAGLLGLVIPEEYGGGGGGIGDIAAVCEELSAQGCPLLLMVVSPAICGTIITR